MPEPELIPVDDDTAPIACRHFHSLRHLAATLMPELGVPLETISATLGHARYAVTADVYAKVHPRLQQQAADAIGASLSLCPSKGHLHEPASAAAALTFVSGSAWPKMRPDRRAHSIRPRPPRLAQQRRRRR